MKTQEILNYPLNFGFITTTLNRNEQEMCKKLHKNVFQNILTKKYLTISTNLTISGTFGPQALTW